MRTQKPHFVITRIHNDRAIWHLAALIIAASLILLLVTAFKTAGAATSPPQGNVVPNFSALKVQGNTEIGGKISNPSGDVQVDDKLNVSDAATFLKDIDVKGGVIKNTGTANDGAVKFDDIITVTGLKAGLIGVISNLPILSVSNLSGSNSTTIAANAIGGKPSLFLQPSAGNVTMGHANAKIDLNSNIINITDNYKGPSDPSQGAINIGSNIYLHKPNTGIEQIRLDANDGKALSQIVDTRKIVNNFGDSIEIDDDVSISGKLKRDDGTNYLDPKLRFATSGFSIPAGNYSVVTAACEAGEFVIDCSLATGETGLKNWNEVVYGGAMFNFGDSCAAGIYNPTAEVKLVSVAATCIKP